MTAYYNEIDPYAAQWLRNLINANLIAPGDVDERSIEDVTPKDLKKYTQCHFFAGIGVWSYALRQAGWEDSRPIWTGSCPCQPFSAAGKGAGFADERHLWPAWFHLIKECEPAIVFGEQVASKDTDSWIDLVQDDMEALDYAFGAVPFPSASIGAPHIRDRLYWVADTYEHQRNRGGNERSTRRLESTVVRSSGGVADPSNRECDGVAVVRGVECDRQDVRWPQSGGESEPRGAVCRLADALDCTGQRSVARAVIGELSACIGAVQTELRPAGPTNGYWRDADWLFCRDGKWRPVESGSFPLAHGAASRVGRLRAYGNAINAEAAKAFINTYLEAQRGN